MYGWIEPRGVMSDYASSGRRRSTMYGHDFGCVLRWEGACMGFMVGHAFV